MKELFKFNGNEGCNVLRHQSEHTYYYGFQSEWQKALILQTVVFSVYATHSILNRSRDILYSLVVRNPKTGYGNSVAYLITNDHSVEPIKNWLVSFKQRNIINPSQITVDCSIPEIDAIRVVSGDVCKIQLFFFPVGQAWNRNLLTKVKTAFTMTDETVKQAVKKTRGLMIAELKTIMYEVDPTANWTAAFIQEAFNYMRTNNYIESWYNQLKSKYLKRIKNRRLDRLVYILYVDVEKDMKLEEQRMELEVGRIGPSVRQRRRREILADKILADEREKMVEQVEDGYVVESFEEEDITCRVKVIDGETRSCECQYFRYRRKACLDMFTEEAQQLQTVATDTNTIEPAESSAEQHNLDRKLRAPTICAYYSLFCRVTNCLSYVTK
ncbi:MAG: hypothetical protein EXX96DRAFT_534095 [Benjaminiella poitrasii]|nr:MAG: hypothetical protein EXX96DRAFT_534095 [Benjaminiella poitrasii]